MQKVKLLKRKVIVVFALALLIFGVALLLHYGRSKPALKIGILHSLTGTMVISEKQMLDALQFAIEEVNAAGGINGQTIEAVIRDCRSDPNYCAQQAEKLIAEEKVSALFGCWTSTCRKAVKTVVEKYRHLLFYPVQYEGMEQSPNIIYTGAAPNQQIIPGTRWALENLGKRVYLLGSDYVFPRMANVIIKDMVKAGGGVVAGERYLPLGTGAMDATVANIIQQHPDVVLNTLNGGSNFALFEALGKAGISAKKIPVLSFSMAEAELASMTTLKTAGHYAAWNYFQSLPSAQNQAFIARFHRRFGAQAVFDDPMEASYIGMMLWAQAAREAGSAEPAKVQRAILRQTLLAPEGMVAVDPHTRHLWKTARIGKVRQDGQFDIVWDAAQAVEPHPFPSYRFKNEWLNLLQAAERGQ
jgi:urea transport system substrate-binding protein